MVWQKTGYQDSIEYDPDRHVLRYGAYEFHGGDLGLKKLSQEIDPSKVKNIYDVYSQLGADQNRIKQAQTATMLYGGSPVPVFSGTDAWKNDAAQRVMDTLMPQKQTGGNIWAAGRATDISTPYGQPERPYTIGTQKLDTGMLQINYADKVPGDYDFVNRVSSMANALASGGGEQAQQRPERRRTATGAF